MMNNREQIEQSIISASAYNGNDTEGLLKEIEDVYKKAQAFDEILEGLPNAMQDALKEDIGLDEAVGIMTGKWSINMRRIRKMTNTLTIDQLQELLQIQKEFDDRIPTLNLRDSKIAYVVEFFEWFNTLETFKNWKKKPGKPLDVQLDELADMLAFGLSIANQVGVSSEEIKEAIESSFKNSEFHNMFNFKDKEFAQDAVVTHHR